MTKEINMRGKLELSSGQVVVTCTQCDKLLIHSEKGIKEELVTTGVNKEGKQIYTCVQCAAVVCCVNCTYLTVIGHEEDPEVYEVGFPPAYKSNIVYKLKNGATLTDGGHICTYKKESSEKVIKKDWFEIKKGTVTLVADPSIKNKDNDCPNFKHRTHKVR